MLLKNQQMLKKLQRKVNRLHKKEEVLRTGPLFSRSLLCVVLCLRVTALGLHLEHCAFSYVIYEFMLHSFKLSQLAYLQILYILDRQ